MIKLALLIAASGLQTAAPSQSTRKEGDFTIMEVKRSFEIPDEIAPAVVPYVDCLSYRTREMQETGRFLSDGREAQDTVREKCSPERDEAVFMASIMLERINYRNIDTRRKLIFDALEAAEKFMLIPPEIDASNR